MVNGGRLAFRAPQPSKTPLQVLGEFGGGASPFSNLSVVGQEAGVSMGIGSRGSVGCRGLAANT